MFVAIPNALNRILPMKGINAFTCVTLSDKSKSHRAKLHTYAKILSTRIFAFNENCDKPQHKKSCFTIYEKNLHISLCIHAVW